jgi:hypothetical protein
MNIHCTAKLISGLCQKNATTNVNALNEKVYAELFLTPNSDSWLGLMSNDSYNAIDNDGIRK